MKCFLPTLLLSSVLVIFSPISWAQNLETLFEQGRTALKEKKYSEAEKMSHISTGGGASLELLEGKVLPGIAALDEV